MRGFYLILITLTAFFLTHSFATEIMPITYLTFEQEDTSTSITVNFITRGKTSESFAYFDVDSQRGKKKDNYKFKQKGRIEFIDGVDKTYHHVKLSNLEADRTYYFKVGDPVIGFSREYKFTTFPSDDSEIRLIIGGDMSVGEKVIETAIEAMKTKPHGIVVGGDIAYANGKIENENRWIQWFEQMNKIMLTPDGKLTPLILAIGNHETTIGTAIPGNRAPFFFTLFPQNGKKSFFARKLGSHTGMIVLDTGHMLPHRSQRKFVKEWLKKYRGLSHRLAVYHAPLYPNHRSYNGVWATRGRRHWLKYFDRYELTAAFEHHDHTLKRTKVLKNNQIAKKGTVYFGDGCWGKNGRESHEKWYLEKSTSDTHIWSVTINKNHILSKAMGKDGEVYDHVKITNTAEETTVESL